MIAQKHILFSGLDADNNPLLYLIMQGESYAAQCNAYREHAEYQMVDIETGLALQTVVEVHGALMCPEVLEEARFKVYGPQEPPP
jgi:hypothetical protein